MATERKKLSCKLKNLIEARQLNQSKLAEATGVGTSTINRLYHNNFQRIDNHTIEQLCTYFDCDISDLLEVK